jgi:hypothetical protein
MQAPTADRPGGMVQSVYKPTDSMPGAYVLVLKQAVGRVLRRSDPDPRVRLKKEIAEHRARLEKERAAEIEEAAVQAALNEERLNKVEPIRCSATIAARGQREAPGRVPLSGDDDKQPSQTSTSEKGV